MSTARAERRPRSTDRRALYVYGLSLALVAVAVLGYLAFVRDAPGARGPFEISWIVLAVGFAVSDNFAIHVEAGDDAHSFNMNELPFVIGLFLCDPRALVLARVVAAAVVLAFVRRQALMKLMFNVCLAAFESVVVVALFTSLTSSTDTGPAAWAVAIATTSLIVWVQTAAIFAAVRLSGARPAPHEVLRTAVLGTVSAAATASLAIATVTLLEVDRVAGAVVMVVIAAVLFAAYRGYALVSRRYSNVAKLYGFTKSVAASREFDAAMRLTVREACQLLRAERAELCLVDREDPRGGFVCVTCVDDVVDETTGEDFEADRIRARVIGDRAGVIVSRATTDADGRHYLADTHIRELAMVPLIQGDAVVGTLAVLNRRGEVSTFDEDDLTVFETLANHASVSLENAQLISRLRQEILERAHQALHDDLTELGNRSLLTDRTDAALEQRRDDEFVAVLLMDLNRFKDVNDTLGHQYGDRLLREVAVRLEASAPRSATITRLGGDEFAVLLPKLRCIDGAVAVATHIQEAMEKPFLIDELHLSVPGSIGVAVAPAHGADTAALLQHADIAMYQAKESPDANIALYNNAQNQHSQRRLTLAADLRQAIEAGALEVHYQPKADLATGTLVGVEALVRWQHPMFGAIAPDEFVPLAERTGLIRPLTQLVLDRALTQLRAWHDLGLEQLHMAINLSTYSLVSDELVNDVTEVLDATRVPPHALTLEITETQMMADPTRTADVLGRLAERGIQISLDDFGTGYSSLSNLHGLPVNELKIDKSFVIDMTTSEAKLAIVRTIIYLARTLNLRVVAEGIEDALTWEALAALGCGIGQGYYLSRPSPAARLTPWLVTRLQNATSPDEVDGRPLRVVVS